jgi:hypothetical protein
MMKDRPVPTFVRAEEGRHTMTLHYLTAEGETGRFTFGHGDDSEFQLVGVGHGGRGSKPDHSVWVYLQKRGEPEPDHQWGTHHFGVALPNPDAHKLTWQLFDFMQSTEHLVERLSRRTPEIKGVSYSDDYITISYDLYGTLKLGLVPELHRFTFLSYGRSFDDDLHAPGQTLLTFAFLDENGKRFDVAFYADVAEVDRIDAELGAFIRSHRRGHNTLMEINYATDHINFAFVDRNGVPSTHAIGTVGESFEYTLTDYGSTWRDEDMAFTLRYYMVRDRAGNTRKFEVLIPADTVADFVAEEHSYFKALEGQHNPKHEAAATSHILQQAA